MLACSRRAELPAALADCDTAACRERWVRARWPEDPQATAEQIAALDDPIARMAVVLILAESHPGQTAALCDALPEGPGRERCEQLNNRPHLFPPPAQTGGPPIPRGLRLEQATQLDNPWAARPPAQASCPDQGLARGCQTDAAVAAAVRGELDAAASLCLAIAEPVWEAECFFMAAEAIVQADPSTDLAGPISLCAAAERFAPQCLNHLVRDVGNSAPPGASRDRRQWSAVLQAGGTIDRTLRQRDPQLTEQLSARLWSHAMSRTYQAVTEPTGDPIDVAGPSITPHAAAAIARQLWAEEGREARDLQAWAARVISATQARHPQQRPAPAHRPDDPPDPPESLWHVELPGEEVLPRSIYLGHTLRSQGMGQQEDAILCVLEAAARHQTPRTLPLLEEALDTDSRIVRWTAARLLGQLAPDSPRLEALESDTDPLIRQRAVHARRAR